MAEDLPAPFGKYFLTEKLATGGMAEIYLAKLIGPGGFEKPIVIKQIHPRLSGQRHFVDLFVAEAKTLVTLAHGNIVPVYELGVVDETYYIAMDYIDGPTLYRLTEALARRDSVMEPAVAAWITARVLDGLDYAHRKGEGVIHRDLSPRNVMLSRDGEVKLVDFGIAVTLGDAAEGDHSSAPTGSFPYMSPEQVRKEPLTPQTDLFSVGVLAWEMLTGQRLFARDNADATLAAVSGEAIPAPSTVRPDVPAKLDEVVMRALDRDLATRWPTAGDMLAAMNKYLYGLDETPGPREVQALVARYCPPETRRLPTHAEAAVMSQHDDAVPVTPAGPRTAVIPRDGEPLGKKKRAPTRQQSFATHVELKDIFERATPMFGVSAMSEGPSTEVTPPPAPPPERGDPTPPIPRRADDKPDSPARSGRFKRVDDTGDVEGVEREANGRPPRDDAAATDAGSTARVRTGDAADRRVDGRPPSQPMLVLLAIGALIVGALALYVFARGRGSMPIDDAAPKFDAAPWAIFHDATVAPDDVAPDRRDASETDAEAHDAAVIDATPGDAAIRDATIHDSTTHDATAHDAAAIDATVHDAAAPTGTATLKIAAIPWGHVTIDGAAAHDAPSLYTVGAGHHTIVVTYSPADEAARSKSFTVDMLPGEEHPIEADFTKP